MNTHQRRALARIAMTGIITWIVCAAVVVWWMYFGKH